MDETNKLKIAVVIPAYRVEVQIERVLSKLPSFVDDVIVVNDCSPDRTRDLVLGWKDARVHLISHQKNLGVGGTMLSGYGYALDMGADVVVKVDGDDQMDLEYLPELIAPLLADRADYAKGNRFLHPTELKRMPFLRKIGNMGLTFLSKLASGYWNVFDPTNGYTAITGQMLLLLDPKYISKDYFYEISMLCELRRLQAVVTDVPIPAIYNDETSSVRIVREFFIFSSNLLVRLARRILNQYFLYDFTVTSFYLVSGWFLGLFGLIWGIVKWVDSAQSGIPATSGTVLIAVLPIILAVQLLLQAVAHDIWATPEQGKDYHAHPIRSARKASRLLDWFNREKASGRIIIDR